mmetsp:Transcript_20360/g.50022  ORF Transcript_20360/g.50022 Transcript_20360/m.50022 type:complete len:378 (+) Transcript_20360:50-1183(+)
MPWGKIKGLLRGMRRGDGGGPSDKGGRNVPADPSSGAARSHSGMDDEAAAPPVSEPWAWRQRSRPVHVKAWSRNGSDGGFSSASTPKSSFVLVAEERKQSPAHTLPIEQGGLTIEQLRLAMREESYVQDDILPYICEILEETIAQNDAVQTARGAGEQHTDVFFSDNETMGMTPTAFVKRLLRYGACSSCSIVLGLLYLGRLKRRLWADMHLTTQTYQRLLVVACLVANKFADDHGANNTKWARAARMTVRELNALELCFLFALSFDLAVQTEEYKCFLRSILLSRSCDEMAILELLSAPKRVPKPSAVPGALSSPEFDPAPCIRHLGERSNSMDSDYPLGARTRSSSLHPRPPSPAASAPRDQRARTPSPRPGSRR